MPVLRGTVQYDGTAYAGFQLQRDTPTIQGALEGALETVTGTASRVVGAGRTDAGVHARGQVISFYSDTHLAPDVLLRALNATLPPDIVLLDLEEAALDFHARYSARSRAYEYIVYNAPLPSPFWRHYSYHVPSPLDVPAMSEALEHLRGRHDFAAFGMPMEHTRDGVTRQGGTTRTVVAAHCRAEPPLVYFYLEADAFLRHMVRQVVGTVVRVGQRRLLPADMLAVLHARRIAAAGPAAPPQGLYLVAVKYGSAALGQVPAADILGQEACVDAPSLPVRDYVVTG